MKEIKSFEDACKKLGIEATLPDVSMLPSDQQKAIIAHYKLVIIAQALNEGWKPNWNNFNEYKYCAWFDMSAPSGFAFDDCACWLSISLVGSRLCFKSRELAKYAGEGYRRSLGATSPARQPAARAIHVAGP